LKAAIRNLKNEFVVIGAHLESCWLSSGLLFPGANDNASGSAGVLEIADAFVKVGIQPKRSVVFVLFASEEQGLNGSNILLNAGKMDMIKSL